MKQILSSEERALIERVLKSLHSCLKIDRFISPNGEVVPLYSDNEDFVFVCNKQEFEMLEHILKED